MGFRFQKRINLMKGFGININKSSITTSYRGKKGSISRKGYSIKTGIPGLTYRNSFTKAKKSGCLGFLIIILVVVVKYLSNK